MTEKIDNKDKRFLEFCIEENNTYSINWFYINKQFRLKMQILKEFIDIKIKLKIENIINKRKEKKQNSKLKNLWLKYCKIWNKYINKEEEI